MCIALAVTVGACSSKLGPVGSGGTSTPSGSGKCSGALPGVTSDSLYPAKVGDEWVYRSSFSGQTFTQTYRETAVTPGSCYTDVTIAITTSGLSLGKSPLPASTYTAVYRLLPDGSTIIPPQSYGTSSFKATTSGGVGQSFPGFSAIVAGKRSSGSFPSTFKSGGTTQTVTYRWQTTGMGTEDVTVPAGTFTGAAKLGAIVEGSATMTLYKGKTTPFLLSFDTTSWYAKGIGLLKTVEKNTGITAELVSTNVKP